MSGEKYLLLHTPGAAGQRLEYVIALVDLLFNALGVLVEGEQRVQNDTEDLVGRLCLFGDGQLPADFIRGRGEDSCHGLGGGDVEVPELKPGVRCVQVLVEVDTEHQRTNSSGNVETWS